MTTQERDLLAIYGRKDVFRKKLREGYTEFCFGQGDWVAGENVMVWIFFHPEGKISTYQFHKTNSLEGVIHHAPFCEECTPEEFHICVAKYRVTLTPRKNLAKFIIRWHSSELFEPDEVRHPLFSPVFALTSLCESMRYVTDWAF